MVEVEGGVTQEVAVLHGNLNIVTAIVMGYCNKIFCNVTDCMVLNLFLILIYL